MDISHPARDLEQRSAAAEQAAIAGAAPPPKLEDLLDGGVVNGESASGGGPVAAPPEATAPEQGKAVDSFGQHTSAYHGVTGDHHHGQWQARAADKRDAYLGTFNGWCWLIFSTSRHQTADVQPNTAITHLGSQEEATEAYDIGAIKFRGLNAVTKFEISRDEDITSSSTSQAEEEDQLGVSNPRRT